MSDYPPEVQAVLDAAEQVRSIYAERGVTGLDMIPLRDAVDAYRKSIAPPEPFEAFLHFADEAGTDDGYWYVDMSGRPEGDEDITYRCTVTPVERVRP